MKSTVKIKDAKSYWLALKKTGWLDWIPNVDHKQLQLNIDAAIKEHGVQFAYLGLTHFSFDFECIFADDSYPPLLGDFASFSRNEFNPKSAKSQRDPKDKKKRLVEFKVGRKKYTCSVDFASDYADECIIDLVNKALTESGSQYQYQNLPAVDQCGYLSFVPQSIFDTGVKGGLIPTQKDVDLILGNDDDD